MRTTLRNVLITTAAVAAAALTLTGCATTRSGSASSGSTPSTTPVTAPSTTPVTAPSANPATVPPSAAPTSGPLVLGPNGLGPLLLGMSRRDAIATGLFATPTKEDPGESCSPGPMTADPHASVWVSDKLGVAAIDAYGAIATPEGIRLGSTYNRVHTAYPAWQGIEGKQGRGLVAVPSDSKAVYRIDVENGKVVSIALQLENQNCYE